MNDQILREAQRLAAEELAREDFRKAVDAEKARLLSRGASRSLKQRLLNALPFTIHWKTK